MTLRRSASRLTTAALLVSAALLASACGGERGSPTEAFAALHRAMEAQDGSRVFLLVDADTRAYHMQRVRTIRARLDRGEDIGDVVPDPNRTPDEFLAGSVEEVAARSIVGRSMLADRWERLRSAEVLGEEIEDRPGRARLARLSVRYGDGETGDLFFIEEPGGWALDQFREFQASRSAR